MLKVGLTGGIASGKSAVGEMFVALGAHLIQADSIAHQLMHPGQPVYDEIVRHFGRGILNLDGTINRPKLADAAFDSKPILEKKWSQVNELNRIVRITRRHHLAAAIDPDRPIGEPIGLVPRTDN